jgi:hypothetical protein
MEKVRVYLKFRSKNENEPSFDEFVEFLNSVNEFHNLLIYLSQNNYPKEDFTVDKLELILHEHRLIITDIKRENPFIFDFIFQIDPEQFFEFLKTLKMSFFMCGMFGVVTMDLIKDIILWLKKHNKYQEEIKEEKELIREAFLNYEKYKKYIQKFCGDGAKIVDLIYSYNEEEFKIIENEKYKEEK